MAEHSFNRSGPYVEDFTGQRYTYTTKKAYDDVIKSLRASVAPTDVFAFLRLSASEKLSGEEFKAAVDKAANKAEKPSGFFLFMEFNHGQWYKYFRPNNPRFHKFVIGNPTILKNMVDFDNVASLNAPWNFLVLEVLDKEGKFVGTKVVFDLPSRTMESETGGEDLNVQSRLLDEKFQATVQSWL